MTEPFVRESGSGPTVICLHASASSSAQWRTLSERLSARFRVLAVDLYGCGRTAPWAQARPLSLGDEVALLAPVWRAAGPCFHLVGHSYGGAVALKAAVAHAEHVASVVLYEPVMFGWLTALEPDGAAAREITAVRDETLRLVASDDLDAAAACFGAYWLGRHTWMALPQVRKTLMAAAMPSVMPQWQAAFGDAMPAQDLARLSMPVGLISGTESTLAARVVSRQLARALRGAKAEELDGCSHMAPVTAPERVNPAIEQFLQLFRSGR